MAGLPTRLLTIKGVNHSMKESDGRRGDPHPNECLTASST
jgi:hypothetical protein